MNKHVIRRAVCLLLAAGLCMGTLISTDAAGEPGKLTITAPEDSTDKPQTAASTLTPVAAPQNRIAELLYEMDLNEQQQEAVSARLGADASLLQLLEQEELTRADLVYLALPNGRTDRLDRYNAWSADHPGDAAETVVLQVNMDRDQSFYSVTREAANPSSLTVLVNKHYALSSGFVPELEVLGGSYGVGSMHPVAAAAFRAMADAAWKDGISLRSVSAYRSYSTQKTLYNRYLGQDSRASVDTYSARPGYSEHQTGLAVDINVASTGAHFENTPAFAWLKAHCAEYGYILRYNQGQDAITGFRFEPWHYRYVGKEAAAAITERGITYEEYVALQPVWGA